MELLLKNTILFAEENASKNGKSSGTLRQLLSWLTELRWNGNDLGLYSLSPPVSGELTRSPISRAPEPGKNLLLGDEDERSAEGSLRTLLSRRALYCGDHPRGGTLCPTGILARHVVYL